MNFLSFLRYCSHHFKYLYWIVLIVLFGSFITAFVTIYTIWPFFSYGLYSYPTKPQPSYNSVELIINDKPFLFFNEMTPGMAGNVASECYNYIFLKQNNYTDSFIFKLKEKRNITLPPFLDPIFKYPDLNDKKFADWLKRYIEQSVNFKIKTIQLNEISLVFKAEKIELIDKKLIFNISFEH